MQKTVAAFEARRQFGRLLQEVMAGKNSVIVEWHGQPAAVLVPMEVYNHWRRSWDRAFELLEKASAAADMSDEEANALAKEAVAWARKQPSEP